MARDASGNLAGSLWMTGAMAGFAVEDAFLKFAAGHLPIGQVLVMMGLAGALIFASVAIRRGEQAFPPALLSRTMVMRSVLEVNGRLFYALAIALTPISTASAILQATPLVVVLGAAWLFQEKVSPWRWLLIALGFVGVLVIIRPGLHGFDALALLALAGMLGFAGRDLATRAAPPALTNAQLGVAGFLVLAVAGVVILLVSRGAKWPDLTGLAMVSGATAFGTCSYAALTNAMRNGEVAVVTPFRYTRLLFAMVVGVVLFHERPDAATFIGSAIIVICGVLILGQKRRIA